MKTTHVKTFVNLLPVFYFIFCVVVLGYVVFTVPDLEAVIGTATILGLATLPLTVMWSFLRIMVERQEQGEHEVSAVENAKRFIAEWISNDPKNPNIPTTLEKFESRYPKHCFKHLWNEHNKANKR